MTHARIGKQISPAFSLLVDFPVGPGVTALYGPSGAGKTLILDAIAGFVPLDSGRILLDDAILFDAEARVDVPPRRRSCGCVFQQDDLFPHLTLRQNLMFAARRWPRLDRHRRVGEMLEKFQLAGAAASRPREIAAPQRLAGSLARALVGEPKLLLVDDRGVDEALLRQIRAVSTSPILLVTANLDLCVAAVDQVVVLNAGRILQRGAPREILDAPQSVDVARILGIPNLFEAAIKILDPGRNCSLLDCQSFELSGPYIPGHFRGDRVWVAVCAEDLRVHGSDSEARPNVVAAQLVRVSRRTRSVRLEFAGGIFADISREEFERQKDNKDWQVEFPPESLRIM